MIRLVGLAAVAAEIERLRAELDALRDPQEFKVTLSKQQLPAALEEKQRQVDYWGDRCCKAEAQRDELLAALKTLITKMDTIHADKDYRSVWFVNQIHTGRYLGPTYVTELECARAAIAAVEERHD